MMTTLGFGVGAARLSAMKRRVGRVKCMVEKQRLIVLVVVRLL